MSTSTITAGLPPTEKPVPWASIVQAILSLLGGLGLLGVGLLLLVVALGQVLQGGAEIALSTSLMAGGMGFSGLLLLPSGVFAFARLLDKPVTSPGWLLAFLRPTRLIWAYPPIVLAGAWVVQQKSIAWIALPILHVLAIGLPVLWVTYLAIRRLPSGSPQRAWGVFAVGLILSPVILLFIEAVLLVISVVVAMLWMMTQPALVGEFQALMQTMITGVPDPQAFLPLLELLLNRPETIIGVMLFGAVLIPLLEELFKPIGVWLMAGNKLSPAAGFVAGAISGAGYALFETLAFATSGSEWTMMVVLRVGTAVVHITTTALTGWALVSAWRKRAYLQLGATYLLAAAIHGLWNAISLAGGVAEVSTQDHVNYIQQVTNNLGQAAALGVLLLTIGTFLVLLLANRRLRQAPQLPPAGEA